MLAGNSKRIFTVFKNLEASGAFTLVPTEKEYHLCLPKEGRRVRFMQIRLAPSEWLESRLQNIENEIILSNNAMHSFQALLSEVGFKPTKGDYDNLRFFFG